MEYEWCAHHRTGMYYNVLTTEWVNVSFGGVPVEPAWSGRVVWVQGEAEQQIGLVSTQAQLEGDVGPALLEVGGALGEGGQVEVGRP